MTLTVDGDKFKRFQEGTVEGLLLERVHRIGSSGRKHVVLNYSMEVVAGKLSRLLEDCCTPALQ